MKHFHINNDKQEYLSELMFYPSLVQGEAIQDGKLSNNIYYQDRTKLIIRKIIFLRIIIIALHTHTDSAPLFVITDMKIILLM